MNLPSSVDMIGISGGEYRLRARPAQSSKFIFVWDFQAPDFPDFGQPESAGRLPFRATLLRIPFESL
jgi:hypothetical protein